MTRPRDSTKARRICYETHRKLDHLGRYYMECRCGRELRPDCGQRIDPGRSQWRAHHNVPWAEGGEDTADNLFPVLTACDAEMTAPEDASRIARNKRIQDRRAGIRKSSRPMPGSKRSPWKRHMDGTVSRRDQ